MLINLYLCIIVGCGATRNLQLPLPQSVMGQLFETCYLGDYAKFKNLFDHYGNYASPRQLNHCISLALASREISHDALLIVKALGPPLNLDANLSDNQLSILYADRRLHDELILTNNKCIANWLMQNDITVSLEALGRLVSKNSRGSLLEMTAWALRVGQSYYCLWPTIDHLFAILNQVHSIEALEGSFREDILYGIILRDRTCTLSLLEGGSLDVYTVYLKDRLAFALNRPWEQIGAVLSSTNPNAPKLLDRLMADLAIDGDLLQKILPYVVWQFGPTCTTQMFKHLSKLVPMRAFLKPNVVKFFQENTKVAPLIFEMFDFPDEMLQDYLSITRSRDDLYRRLDLLDLAFPAWPLSVFDASPDDPIGKSLASEKLFAVQAFLDAIPTRHTIQSSGCSFVGLEILPLPLFKKFSQIYRNFPLHQPPQTYKWYHLASPKVLFHLMGQQARPLHAVDIATVLTSILPMSIQCRHAGWLIEVLRRLQSILEPPSSSIVEPPSSSIAVILPQFQDFLGFLCEKLIPLTRQGHYYLYYPPTAISPLEACANLIAPPLNEQLNLAITWLDRSLKDPGFLSEIYEKVSEDFLAAFIREHSSAYANVQIFQAFLGK